MVAYSTTKRLGGGRATPNARLGNFMDVAGGGMMGNLPQIQTPSPIPAPPKFEMSTERDPRLERLAGGFEQHVGDIRAGTTPAITGYMQEVEAARRG